MTAKQISIFGVATTALVLMLFGIRFAYVALVRICGYYYLQSGAHLMAGFLLTVYVIFSCFVLYAFLVDSFVKRFEYGDLIRLFFWLLCLAFFIPITCILVPPAAPLFLDGFEKWAAEEIDVEQVQDWANQVEDDTEFLEGSDCPKFISKHSPTYVIFHDNFVQLRWGGGFASWGIDIALNEDGGERFARDLNTPYERHLSADAIVWHSDD